MKNLNIAFEDKEYDKLEKLKPEGETWKQAMLISFERRARENV